MDAWSDSASLVGAAMEGGGCRAKGWRWTAAAMRDVAASLVCSGDAASEEATLLDGAAVVGSGNAAPA